MLTRFRGAVFALTVLGSGVAVPLSASPAQAGTSPALFGYDDGSAGVFEAPIGGSTQASLVAAAGIHPQFSPNGTEIAYDLERSTSGGGLTNSVVVADRNGGAPRDLVTGPTTLDGTKTSVLYPLAWSPNGKEIAYGCDGQSDAPSYDAAETLYTWEQVCVVNVTTGDHRMITDPTTDADPPSGGGLDEGWSWTPDGKEIIATVDRAGPCLSGFSFAFGCGTSSIGAVDVDSGAVSVLTKSSLSTSIQYSPAVSPDGEHILFTDVTEGSGARALEIMNAGGGGARVLDIGVKDPTAGEIFSPDGKDVAYTAFPADDPYYVQAFEIPLSGEGKPTQLTTGNRSVYDMTWSPAVTTCTVPILKGQTLAAAKKLLAKAACTLGTVRGPTSHRATRHVIKQSPKAKLDEPAGTRVNVTLK